MLLHIQPMGKSRRKKSCSPVQVSHEHQLRLVPDNIISPLRLPSPGGSITINEAAAERQLRASGYSLRQSQWSQYLDAEFEPCLQNLSAPRELELFCKAAASPSPVNHLLPHTHT